MISVMTCGADDMVPSDAWSQNNIWCSRSGALSGHLKKRVACQQSFRLSTNKHTETGESYGVICQVPVFSVKFDNG